MDIRLTPELAAALGLEKRYQQQQEWSREHVQTDVVPGGVNRKGQIVVVPVFRKQWRKLRAQIAYAQAEGRQAGIKARNRIYPPRHKLWRGALNALHQEG